MSRSAPWRRKPCTPPQLALLQKRGLIENDTTAPSSEHEIVESTIPLASGIPDGDVNVASAAVPTTRKTESASDFGLAKRHPRNCGEASQLLMYAMFRRFR